MQVIICCFTWKMKKNFFLGSLEKTRGVQFPPCVSLGSQRDRHHDRVSQIKGFIRKNV